MKITVKDSSATVREHTPERDQRPHAKQTTKTPRSTSTARQINAVGPLSTAGPTTAAGTTRTAAIINVLKQRAHALLSDESLDAQSRAVIRQGIETNDPWLTQLLRRADFGDPVVEPNESAATGKANSDRSHTEKVEALTDIICGGGEECAGALLVLMGMVANSPQPEVLAHTVKHFALTRCGELNVFGMVDTQIAVIEGELLAGNYAGGLRPKC